MSRTLRTIDSWPCDVRDIVDGVDKTAVKTIEQRWKQLKADRKANRV